MLANSRAQVYSNFYSVKGILSFEKGKTLIIRALVTGPNSGKRLLICQGVCRDLESCINRPRQRINQADSYVPSKLLQSAEKVRDLYTYSQYGYLSYPSPISLHSALAMNSLLQ